MADKQTGVLGNAKNRTTTVLFALLVVLVLCYGANVFLSQQATARTAGYLSGIGALNVLSQEIAKNATSAAAGQLASFDALAANKSAFETELGYLRDGR